MSFPELYYKNKVIDSNVELMDIAPTILDYLKIEWKKYNQFKGRSLMPLLRGRSKESKMVFSGGNHGRIAIIESGWKYYYYDKTTKEDWRKIYLRYEKGFEYKYVEEIYNIKNDPLESVNVISDEKNILSRLREVAFGFKGTAFVEKSDNIVEIDDKTREKLKALGYIN